MGEITGVWNILAGKPHTFETYWVQGRIRVTFMYGTTVCVCVCVCVCVKIWIGLHQIKIRLNGGVLRKKHNFWVTK